MPTVHINQPRFLPALNYFQRMLLADYFVYLDTVQYSSGDWENRNKVRIEPGKWTWLTVPVQKAPKGTRITEILIDDSQDWRTKMCRTVREGYVRADHFKKFYPQFEMILLGGWKDQPLVTLNYALIDMFREAWGLDKCKFVLASDLCCQGKSEIALLNICKALGATHYLSGAEGRKYNDPERWQKAGIELHHHEYEHPRYRQQFGDFYFMQWMSALDLLLNRGSDEGRDVLEVGSLNYLERLGKL